MEKITTRVQQFRQHSNDRRAFCLNRSPPHGETAPSFHRKRQHTKPKLQFSSLLSEFRGTATKDTENLSSTSFSSCALTLSCERRGKRTHGQSSASSVPSFTCRLLRLEDTKERRRTMNHCLDRRSIILPQQLSGIRKSIAVGMMA